ncbi:hypothetical protein HELRODRAFT_160843 [Helobdella robusta]|uniref:LITAF domain-containing protein n=1 Tax=Helobdella robusta TaxID=6412 RepID=T1EQT3_HELRO|nr:hypothetical protein HELRODRAFT_160843 [Helobdella robusta]ESO06653.1 hypothetical protein HELRODRAFT_160843 [Helobdella robusta]
MASASSTSNSRPSKNPQPAQTSGQQMKPPLSNNAVYTRVARQVTCKYCGNEVQTLIDYSPGVGAFLLCGSLFVLGFVFGCCLIPLLLDSCRDVKHYCPNCGKLLGRRDLL